MGLEDISPNQLWRGEVEGGVVDDLKISCWDDDIIGLDVPCGIWHMQGIFEVCRAVSIYECAKLPIDVVG